MLLASLLFDFILLHNSCTNIVQSQCNIYAPRQTTAIVAAHHSPLVLFVLISDCIETVGKESETLEIEDSSDEEMSASVLTPGAGNKSNSRDNCAAAAERRR